MHAMEPIQATHLGGRVEAAMIEESQAEPKLRWHDHLRALFGQKRAFD